MFQNCYYSESRNQAFSIDLVCLQMLKFLAIPDIKNFRLINSLCNTIGLQLLLKQSYFSFDLPKIRRMKLLTMNSVTLQGESELHLKFRHEIKEFIATNPIKNVQNLKVQIDDDRQQDIISISKLLETYKFTLNKLNYHLYCTDLTNPSSLLQGILPQLRTLKKLTLDIHFYPNLSQALPSFLPTEPTSITDLTIKFSVWCPVGFQDHAIMDEKVTLAISDFAHIFPNLKTLTLKNELCDKLARAILYDNTVRLQLKCLQGIEIEPPILQDWEEFSNYRFYQPLTRLSVAFDSNMSMLFLRQETLRQISHAYETLLWNHAQSLTDLTLRTRALSINGSPVELVVPTMPSLVSLKLLHKDNNAGYSSGSCNYSLKFQGHKGGEVMAQGFLTSDYPDYEVQFPKLVRLSFAVECNEYVLPPNITIAKLEPLLDMFVPMLNKVLLIKCTTLRYFTICGVQDSEWKNSYLHMYLSSIAQAFPNVYYPVLNEFRMGTQNYIDTSGASTSNKF